MPTTARKPVGALLIASPFIALAIAAYVIDGTDGLLGMLLGLGISVVVGLATLGGLALIDPSLNPFREGDRHD